MPTAASNPALDAFLHWVEGRFGGPVAFAEPPVRSVEGFDNDIYFARLTGAPLPPEWTAPVVLRMHQSPARLPLAEREAAVYRFLNGLGYPAPRMLAVVPPDGVVLPPVQVLERVPGTTMMKAMIRRPWRIPALVDVLAGLHARLHGLATDGWPFPDERAAGTNAPGRRRLGLVRAVVAEQDSVGEVGMAEALERVERHLPNLVVDEHRVVHGDLHPMNVVVDNMTANVVDWTDASVGDPYADVSRMVLLFEAAAVGAPSAVVRATMRGAGPSIVRRFLATYASLTGRSVDMQRLASWEPVQRLHDWARVALTAASPERSGNIHRGTLAWARAACLRSIETMAA